ELGDARAVRDEQRVARLARLPDHAPVAEEGGVEGVQLGERPADLDPLQPVGFGVLQERAAEVKEARSDAEPDARQRLLARRDGPEVVAEDAASGVLAQLVVGDWLKVYECQLLRRGGGGQAEREE